VKKQKPRCIIIAGPNGCWQDDVREELSAAGRILLEELDRLTKAKESFALESTLSGRTYIELIQRWKKLGYRTAKEARRVAKMHGTKVWVMKDGQLVGLNP
jgi:hypothetical protein